MAQNEIDRLSIEKAKELFAAGKIYEIEVGTTGQRIFPVGRRLIKSTILPV